MQGSGVYFFHIPKTAGTSIYRFLDGAFPAEKICPWGLWDQLITVPPAELGSWDIFRGHFLSHLEPFLGRQLTTFTVLRDPVERTISHYYHVRRAQEHPSHGHARRLSLADFCVHPETRHMVGNYQALYLAKRPSNVAQVERCLSQNRVAPFALQERLQHPDDIRDPTELFERAEERLSTFKVVGVTEQFDDALRQISRALNCPLLGSIERLNVNPEQISAANVDDATLNLIRDLTQVDQRLYRSLVSRSSF